MMTVSVVTISATLSDAKFVLPVCIAIYQQQVEMGSVYN